MGYKLAVVGATGLVGQEYLKILEQRKFPVDGMIFLSNNRAIGKRIYFLHQEHEVKELTAESFKDIDLVVFLGGSDVSRHYAPFAIQTGAIVIDNSPAFRSMPLVPLVVPEVNAEDLQSHRGIIANPTCLTIQTTMALYPLHCVNPIKRIIAVTYHPVSSMGANAMEELTDQTKQIINGQTAVPHVFPHQIAFNVLPEVDVFLDNGYTREEAQLIEGAKRILHSEEIAVSATCVRVPVLSGHSSVVYVELSKPMTADEAEYQLIHAPGIKILDDPNVSLYPQPWSIPGTDEVCIGRIRTDSSHPNGLTMWTVVDNLRKGAALNIVQVMEELVKRELLRTVKEEK